MGDLPLLLVCIKCTVTGLRVLFIIGAVQGLSTACRIRDQANCDSEQETRTEPGNAYFQQASFGLITNSLAPGLESYRTIIDSGQRFTCYASKTPEVTTCVSKHQLRDGEKQDLMCKYIINADSEIRYTHSRLSDLRLHFVVEPLRPDTPSVPQGY